MTPPTPRNARERGNPTRATLLGVLAILAAALAGCSTTTSASTSLHIDFPAPHADVDATVAFDGLAGKATLGPGLHHAAFATAHDQLASWAATTGTSLEIHPFSFGSCVDRIDHLPTLAGCSSNATAYWELAVNGVVAGVGMDDVELHSGDSVLWTLRSLQTASQATQTPSGSQGAPAPGAGTVAAQGDAGGSGALALELAAPAPTRNATVLVSGKVSRAAHVAAANATAVDVAAGPFVLEVAVRDGESVVHVTADDGRTTVSADVVAVRLSKATFTAKFTAYPVHPDLAADVWLDLDAHASAPLYEGTAASHPAYATVHDLLVAYTAQSGKAIEYGGPGSFGFSVDKVDGVGQPVTASAPPYWCYKLNGSSGTLGISAQELHAGDVVAWEYAGCA